MIQKSKNRMIHSSTEWIQSSEWFKIIYPKYNTKIFLRARQHELKLPQIIFQIIPESSIYEVANKAVNHLLKLWLIHYVT